MIPHLPLYLGAYNFPKKHSKSRKVVSSEVEGRADKSHSALKLCVPKASEISPECSRVSFYPCSSNINKDKMMTPG